MTRIVEFVYQGAIHKGYLPLNRLLIAYLLCKNAYPTHTSLNFQANNPRNPCHPRKSAIQKLQNTYSSQQINILHVL